jgi:hypothetical protein
MFLSTLQKEVAHGNIKGHKPDMKNTLICIGGGFGFQFMHKGDVFIEHK